MSRLIERAIIVKNTFYSIDSNIEWLLDGKMNDILNDAFEIGSDSGWDIFHIHDGGWNSLKGCLNILNISGVGVELL